MALSVPLSRFTPRVGGGSAFFVRPQDITLIMKTTTKTLIAVITTALIVVGCATTKTSKWEYRTRTTEKRMGPNMLDGYGKTGWELVEFQPVPVVQTDTNHVVTTNMEFQYVFKRPKK